MNGTDENTLSNCCVWFENFHDLHKILASVVRAWITDNVPAEIAEAVKETVSKYTYDNTEKQVVEYIDGVFANRKKEMESLITYINSQEEK
jgi:hypothetical protein